MPVWNRTQVKNVSLNANTAQQLALLLHRAESSDPPHSQISNLGTEPRRGLPESAVVHFTPNVYILQERKGPTCPGWMELDGRTLPVTVVIDQPRLTLSQEKLASLVHPRITPLLGLADIRPGKKALVIPDQGSADLWTYGRKHPDVDKRHLVLQLAEGLAYLHYQACIVHGNLDWDAVEFDNGALVLRVARIGILHSADKWDNPLIYHYLAPELRQKEPRARTRASDVYAFGELAYEILSGSRPWSCWSFWNCHPSQCPTLPADSRISESMWELCRACWNPNPARRPDIVQIMEFLRGYISPDTFLGKVLQVDVGGVTLDISLPMNAAGQGGSGTVMKGTSRIGGVDTLFAVKVCRNDKVMPREYKIWKSLQHANILPLCGALMSRFPGPRLHIFVSPYFDRGTLLSYLKSSPNAPRLPLMIDVARGLAYLHNDKGIVHGDIKSENVLIGDNGTAVLSDFGLSTTVDPHHSALRLGYYGSMAQRHMYTMPYCAPEIVDEDADDPSVPGIKRSKTKMSDMYANGVLLYETYTELGWRRGGRGFIFMAEMDDGRLPPRPFGRDPVLCDDIWSICTRCWAKEPLNRPPIATMLRELEELSLCPERQITETADPQAVEARISGA